MNVDDFNAAVARILEELLAELEAPLAARYAKIIRKFGAAAAAAYRTQALVASARSDELFDEDAVAAEVTASTLRLRQAAVERVIGGTLASVGVTFDVAPVLVPALLEHIGIRSRDLTAAMHRNLRGTIERAVADGLTVPQTAAAIQAGITGMAGSTATMLARTDLISLGNGASTIAAREVLPPSSTKTWISAGDDRVRPSHEEADGQTVPIDQSFQVGGDQLDYPGDPSGSDEEVINCRCTLIYEEGPEQETEAAAAEVESPFGSQDDVSRLVLDGAPDTQTLHAGPAGGYTAERVASFHDPVIARALSDAVPDRANPTTLFMAGGPGSGKSTVLNALSDDVLPDRPVLVNPDEIKEAMPEYRAMVEGESKYAAAGAHEESSDIAKAMLTQAVRGGYNAVVDGTGDSQSGKFLSKIEAQLALDRQVKVVMVDIPTDVAVARAEKRAARTGRHVPEAEIRKVHGSVAYNHLQWRDIVDDWEVWANDVRPPELIAHRVGGGPTVILNETRYAEALAKAKEATS